MYSLTSRKIDVAFDKQHLWHPYTSMTQPLECYPVTKAEGVYLYLDDGRKLIDGMASWWAAIHGYNHPVLNKALEEQAKEMSHVMFGGLTHRPAVELGKKLIKMTPLSLDCLFFADSGSVAVEIALKMNYQYWHAKQQKRTKVVSLTHAYHGDTWGAMAVCDPKNSMHYLYSEILPQHIFLPVFSIGYGEEWNDEATNAMEKILATHANEIGAIIIEPIVQGAGGMRMYHPQYLKKIRELCDYYGFLLIADEIATGFGRTGTLFACQQANIQPDILCLGKALTGGYLTLSAVLTTRTIANVISEGVAGCFMHGPTYMANPLATAVALANLQLLEESSWEVGVSAIEQQLKKELIPLQNHPEVHEVRVLGAIGVVELKRQVNQEKIQAYFVSQGVWIRPFNRLLYIMPPYIINADELSLLTQSIVNLLHLKNLEDYLL